MVSHTRSNLLMSIVLAMLMIGTALAMVPVPVRGENEPDLTLEASDIHFSDNEPESGDNITIYATIHNEGDGNASDILVLFRDHSHGEGNVTTIGNRTIRFLGSGEQENVSIVWTADPAGNHTIKVLIDPEESIKESNEENNNAGKNIVVKEGGGGEEKTTLRGYTKKESDSTHIPHVDIRVSKGNYSETMRSDSDGLYEVELVEGGWYSILAEKEGYEDFETELNIPEGETTSYHIRMKEEGSGNRTLIQGHVYEKESRGTPIYDAEITLTGKSGNQTYSTSTDRDGYYEQEVEHQDNFTITAEKDGYESETQHRYVDEGDTEEVNFHLQKEGGSNKTTLQGYTKEKSNGTHIPDVKVTIEKGPHQWYTYSDGDGYYEFDQEEGGNYTVYAEREGYLDYEETIHLQFGKETTHHIRMELEDNKETWIHGYIFEKERGGTPIYDATVTIIELSCYCTYQTYSDEEGYYKYKLTEGGNYSVEVKKEGYGSQTKELVITEGEWNRLDFQLEKDGGENRTVIWGYTKEQTRGGIITHVNITISDVMGNHTNTTTSGADGYYEFELPGGGTYRIEGEKEGYKDYLINVSVEEGEEKLHYIYMEEESSGGTILNGYTMEKTRGGGTPEVVITITKGNFTDSTYSNSEGYYEFELAEGGTYHVEAEKPGYEVFSGNVSVPEGETTTYNIHLERTATGSPWIIGYVKDGDTRSPISQATISVTGLECNCSYTTLTNKDGYYEIELDLAGNYTVRVEKEGYESQSVKAYAAEGSEEYVGFYLEKTGTRLKGHVWEGETRGGGIKDVKIRIESANESYIVYTDLNGYYEKEISQGGEYTITASKEGYLSQTKSITIDQGEEKIVDFYLQPDVPEKPAKERYQVQLTASKYTLDLEGTNRTIVSLTIENTGLEEDSYTLTAAGTYKGWKITWDYTETITIAPGRAFVMNMTLSEDLVESPDGDTILVEVVVRSETYADVYDSVRIEGKLEETNGIPDLTIPLIAASLTVGALVASFRRRF